MTKQKFYFLKTEYRKDRYSGMQRNAFFIEPVHLFQQHPAYLDNFCYSNNGKALEHIGARVDRGDFERQGEIKSEKVRKQLDNVLTAVNNMQNARDNLNKEIKVLYDLLKSEK